MTRIPSDSRADGIWIADRKPDFGDERWCRVTLKVALELGRWRAFAAGTWWTYRPYHPWVPV